MRDDGISEALWRAYEETTFEVDQPDGSPSFSIRIGERATAIDALLTRHGLETWAFVTAWNPASRPLPRAENDARNRVLRALLDAAGKPVFTGRGIGAEASWDPEESFLILGISATAAALLGRRFGQNAIVVGRRGGGAELLACDRRPPDQT